MANTPDGPVSAPAAVAAPNTRVPSDKSAVPLLQSSLFYKTSSHESNKPAVIAYMQAIIKVFAASRVPDGNVPNNSSIKALIF